MAKQANESAPKMNPVLQQMQKDELDKAKEEGHVPHHTSFQEFPKWKYHPKSAAVLVHSKEAEAQLGKEWGDTPDHGKAKSAKKESDEA